MIDTLRLASAVTLAGLASSCGGGLKPEDVIPVPNTLISYVSEKGYEPLRIPRTKWGPGTVVSFDERGNENIVMFNDQCVRFAEPPLNSDRDTIDVRVADASLNSARLTRGRAMGVDVELEKGISAGIDLGGAFSDRRVREIQVNIGAAKQFTISDLTLTRKIRTLLATKSECAQLLLKKGNFVVDDVLVVKNSSFSFIGSGNTKINLDLGLLRAIRINPEFESMYDGGSELPIEAASIIGYKLYAVDAALAPAGTTLRSTSTNLTVRRLAPSEINSLKKRN